MVVHDQDSDANHVTPFPRLRVEQGIPKVRKAPELVGPEKPGKDPENDDRRGYDTRGEGTRAARPPPLRTLLPPPRAPYPPVSPPERHRPPPVLLHRVRTGARGGRRIAELAARHVYGVPHVSY
ncbi:hypothetical protein GCM10010345_24850 [Streptomyces canarius]|uniref:Uncharacterized protein n=1 Tax=Streptomyces canarius TaxID=285453 RepID=A0ABQ3CJK4_9ACTN|nr:hypothetical protein GCM10010345_24850 [Streptomyces canarius]